MNPETSHQVPESSLSKVTEQSARSEAIVALGKKLVTELDLGDSVDTLGRWMAHYVAELVHETEAATGDDRSAKQLRLRDAILALWSHRFEMPPGKRPFGEFEPILRSLASIDPDNQSSRYFSPSRAPDNGSSESKETLQWIEMASALDQISKVLISYCLTMAADKALDKSKEWVKLAEDAGLGNGFEFLVIRFVKDQSDLTKKVDLNASERRILKDRHKKLEAFLALASKLTDDIKVRLDSLPPAVEDSDELTLSEPGRL